MKLLMKRSESAFYQDLKLKSTFVKYFSGPTRGWLCVLGGERIVFFQTIRAKEINQLTNQRSRKASRQFPHPCLEVSFSVWVSLRTSAIPTLTATSHRICVIIKQMVTTMTSRKFVIDSRSVMISTFPPFAKEAFMCLVVLIF